MVEQKKMYLGVRY